MYKVIDMTQTRLKDSPHSYQTQWASARLAKRLDTEMAAFLRMTLQPVFDCAGNWDDLGEALQAKGFYLARHGQSLHLHDSLSHVEICSCGFLGFPSAALQERLAA